jgi:hypothetical protein
MSIIYMWYSRKYAILASTKMIIFSDGDDFFISSL